MSGLPPRRVPVNQRPESLSSDWRIEMEKQEVVTPGAGEELAGLFITFEGCEGSGKTTQVEMLREYLLEHGYDVVVVREPGGTPLGEKMREILLDPATGGMEPVTEALLFAADRVQHVKEIIRPSLEKGCVVLGDRFVDSSLAYQGVGRGVGLEAVKNLNDWAIGGLEPSLTFYLDVPAATALERKTSEQPDRIEQESLEFHENVRHAYAMLVRIYSNRVVALDGSATPEAVHAEVVSEVSKHLGEGSGA